MNEVDVVGVVRNGLVHTHKESPVYKQYKLDIGKRLIREGLFEVDENMRSLLRDKNFCFSVEQKASLRKELKDMVRCLNEFAGLLK